MSKRKDNKKKVYYRFSEVCRTNIYWMFIEDIQILFQIVCLGRDK